MTLEGGTRQPSINLTPSSNGGVTITTFNDTNTNLSSLPAASSSSSSSSAVPSLAPAMARVGLMPHPPSIHSNPTPSASPSLDYPFSSSHPLDSIWHDSYYPGLLESMRLGEGRSSKVRTKILSTGSWKKILTFVIETSSKAANNGGGGVNGPFGSGGGVGGLMKKKDSLPAPPIPSPRSDLLRGFGAGEEVYGLGGGYNPLAKERVRGGGGKNARFREPDTESWNQWQADDWKSWKDFRQREKERLSKMSNGGIFIPQRDGIQGGSNILSGIGPSALLAAGVKSAPAPPRTSSGTAAAAAVASTSLDPEMLLATATSKLKRDDLKSSMDLNLDLNPLDHIHTVRHTYAPTSLSSTIGAGLHGKKKAKALLAAHAKLRAADSKSQREQKQHASELYRNIWIQQMKVMKSNKSLQHYSEVWDRKLQGYKMTLERDGQGNKIRALHLLDEKTKRKVLLAQNGYGGGDTSSYDLENEVGDDGDPYDDDDDRDDRSDDSTPSDGGGDSSSEGENRHSHHHQRHRHRRHRQRQIDEEAGGETSTTTTMPIAIRKLQASNPHKHVYHGAMSARNYRNGMNGTSLAELSSASVGAGGGVGGSLTSRVGGVGKDLSSSSMFDAMLSAGISSTGSLVNGNPPTTKSRGPNLFARAILQLKNRKAILSFTDIDMIELKEIFDGLARDGYSKITKSTFKTIIATNFGHAGGIGGGNVGIMPLQHHQHTHAMHATHAQQTGTTTTSNNTNNTHPSQQPPKSSTTSPAVTPLYIDRTRLDPLLDRLWLAVNSNGRNSNFLDFADFTQMVGIALNGTIEDKASFAFEIYDMDDDGYFDIHDLFVCLHLSLDEYFPRDFQLLAMNLYEKMDLHDRIWRRRQEKIMDLASMTNTNTNSNNGSVGPSAGVGNGVGVSGNIRRSNVTSSSQTSGTSNDQPYLHQDLPVLHITKAEFIRLHQQVHAYTTMNMTNVTSGGVGVGGGVDSIVYPNTARDSTSSSHLPPSHRPNSQSGSSGSHTFRSSHHHRQQSTANGGGGGVSSSTFHTPSPPPPTTSATIPTHPHQPAQLSPPPSLPLLTHQIDLLELVSKAFIIPYRKSLKTSFANTALLGGNTSVNNLNNNNMNSTNPNSSLYGFSTARDRDLHREREKEKALAAAAAAGKNAGLQGSSDEKSNGGGGNTAGMSEHRTHVPKHLAPMRLASQVRRRSVQLTNEEVKTTIGQQQSSTNGPSPPASSTATNVMIPKPPTTTSSAPSYGSTTLSNNNDFSNDSHQQQQQQPQPNEIDQLLLRLRTTSNNRLSKSVFRKIFLSYLSNGPNHQFHTLNPLQASLDLQEEEKIIDFLFHSLDLHKSGMLDGTYVAGMLSHVLKGDMEQQLQFYSKLLDFDRDGMVTAKDLCMAHDLTTSYTLRTDLKVLLDVFSNKIEQVILNTRRTVHELEVRQRRTTASATTSTTVAGSTSTQQQQANRRDVLPETMTTGQSDIHGGVNGVDGQSRDDQDSTGFQDSVGTNDSSEPSSSSSTSSPPVSLDQHQQLAQLRLHAHVGLTREEFHDALLKFNPSLFLKILKRVPYQREKRFQAASLNGTVGHGGGRITGGKANAHAHHHAHHSMHQTNSTHPNKDGDGSMLLVASTDPQHPHHPHPHHHHPHHHSRNVVMFDELNSLHRSILKDMKVVTQQSFEKFPDLHNSNIGDQIMTLRRSLDFQQDCQYETRIFYVANQFGTNNTNMTNKVGVNNVGGVGVATGGIVSTFPNPSLQSLQLAMDTAYTTLQRLLTRVPQVYVQWTLLQDGSKHTSIETAKFRKLSQRYNLLTKEERRKARFKMIATPGAIYAYGGFPRPKNGDLDRADLQHYGTPLRCILLSVSGAQLNEEGLDDIDFIRTSPSSGEKYLDQPNFFYELCMQVHMWLTGFVEMIELENIRALGGGQMSFGQSTSSSSASSSSSSTIVKTGLMRVVRIGAGNFASVPGLKEHQGNLIAYLLMQAFLFNLRKNAQVQQPPPPPIPIDSPPAGTRHHHGHVKTASMAASVGGSTRGSLSASSSPAQPASSAPAPPPTIVSGYKNLSVLEFIFFDESACPIQPDPSNGHRRMCGGVELRFTKCDVLELTTHQTSNHHIGILNPTDSFALPGNEEGYTSLSSMMGNNTSLRLSQCYHFNPHLLHQPNYVPIELPLELSSPHYDHDMWREMKTILTSEASPKRWIVNQQEEEEDDEDDDNDDDGYDQPASDAARSEGEYDPEDLDHLTTDM